ncbi:MAG: hypothetical protein FVQ79_02970 [Planctomycetes bacterium]|nr:hypothetical protein [Planctomycetota bacterium]
MRFQYERISFLVFLLIAIISISWAGSCQVSDSSSAENNSPQCESTRKTEIAKNPSKPPQTPDKPITEDKKNLENLTLDEILDKLTASNKSLKSYQARMKYTFIQDPEVIDSNTIRKGNIYYQKGKKRSDLLIDFTTIKQDDAPEEKHNEKYLFDGVYLKIIDFQNKTVNTYQKAEKNNPKDVFEVIGASFPMVGFTRPEFLKREFNISLAERTKTTPTHVIPIKLDVKKGSIYEKEYKTIDFWINKAIFLPARLLTTSTEGDIYDIILTDAKINKKLPKGIFKVETLKDFSETITPLEK